MDEPRRQLPVLPVACTLGGTDGAAQVERWRRLNRRSLARRERREGELLLVYRADEPARAELQELVAVEQTCCAFLEWQVDEPDGGLRLRIRGAATDLDTLDLR